MKLNEKMILVMVAVLALFFVAITTLVITYYTPKEDYQEWVTKVEKQEKIDAEKKPTIYTRRGEIRDRNGEVLALSEDVKDKKTGKITGQKRVYPYDELFAHTVGYFRGDYKGGRYMLEESYDDKLMMLSEEDKEKFNDRTFKEYIDGGSLDLTLDLGMTKKAKELLDNTKEYKIEKGSIVVMNPKTGEIYCMYSNPTFDPNPEALSKNLKTLMADKVNEPLRSRSTYTYPPGSVYKIVTALAALESGNEDFEYEDKVSDIVGGSKITNSYDDPKGLLEMKAAIKYSSNVYFANLAVEIGSKDYLETAAKLFINKVLKIDIPITDASVGKNKDSMTDGELAEAGWGQGTAMMSPLHMAMVASTVANNGVLVTPYFVSKVTLSNGDVEYEANPEKIVVTNKSVRDIRDGMIQCVNSGTGTAAAVSGLQIAGKTGTAQKDGGKDHTWFIGFAPAYDPQIAICVFGERTGGYGGSICGPVAKEMIKYCRENGFITE